MEKPTYHVFVCNSFRLTGGPQGVCNKKGATSLLQYLQDEIVDRGVDAMITSTGCVNLCEKGPVMIVYPGGWWYTEVTEEKIDDILDALEDGEPVEALLMS